MAEWNWGKWEEGSISAHVWTCPLLWTAPAHRVWSSWAGKQGPWARMFCFHILKLCVYFLSSKITLAYSPCGSQSYIEKYGWSLPFNNLSCCLFLNLMDETNDPEFVINGTPSPLQPQLINQWLWLVPVISVNMPEALIKSGAELVILVEVLWFILNNHLIE